MALVEFGSFLQKLHPCSNVILSANKFIRKMRGGSQSVLLRANDGKHYVVKMMANSVGPNVLANEYMGSLIAKDVGLPVAEAKGIFLSDSFIDSNPGLWFELPSGILRPDQGVHFASLLVGQTFGPERPTEYISPSRANMITNREAFLGMYLLDVWANHQDSRKAVLLRRSDNTQEVFFIDHGHMFGGPEWNFTENPRPILHLEMEVYTNLWEDDKTAAWISHFQSVVPKVLTSVVGPMPSQWYTGDLAALTDRLNDRLANLPELVREDAGRTWHTIQQRSIDETLRLSDSGIHDLGTPDTRSALRRSRATA